MQWVHKRTSDRGMSIDALFDWYDILSPFNLVQINCRMLKGLYNKMVIKEEYVFANPQLNRQRESGNSEQIWVG
jgi:hypothetical protein